MADRRIVVTGLGAVSALGHDVEATWAAARDGRGGIASHLFDPGPNGPEGHSTPTALVEGDVTGPLEALLGRRVGASLDPFALYAVKVAHEALSQAGLIGAPPLEKRTAAIFGHGFAGIHNLEASYERFYGRKSYKVHPLTVPRVMVSAPAAVSRLSLS